MPSILLPHVIEQQQRIEEKIEEERRRLLPPTIEDLIVDYVFDNLVNKKTITKEELRCSSYKDFEKYIYEELLGLPEWAKEYFNFHQLILRNYDEGMFYIIYNDNGRFVNIDNFYEVMELINTKNAPLFIVQSRVP